MNLGDFRSMVGEYLKFEAQPYIALTDTTNLNKVVNERLIEFTKESKCLFDNRIAFTLTPSQAQYDLRGSAFSRAILEPIDMMVNGSFLLDFWGRRGPISYGELTELYPTYITDTAAQPAHWMMMVPQTVELYPKPDAAYSSSYVTGFYLHAALANDADLLQIPGDCERAAAAFTAAALLEPRMGGSSAERRDKLLSIAQERIDEYFARADRMLAPTRVRGKLKDTAVRRLN